MINYVCALCGDALKSGEETLLNQEGYSIHAMCFNAVFEAEHKLPIWAAYFNVNGGKVHQAPGVG